MSDESQNARGGQKNTLVLVVAALVIVGVIAALLFRARVTKDDSAPAVFRVGSVLFLTGPAASYGEMQKSGFEIALEEINAQGIRGRRLEVVYEDSAHQEPKAVAAVKKLIAVDRVPLIVEITGSGEAVAAAPVAGEQQVVVLSAIDSTEKLSGISPYFFRIMPSDAIQGRFLAEWASDSGWKKAAVIHVTNEWGVGMRDSVRERFVAKGGELAIVEGTADAEIDFRTVLTKTKEQSPDGVFLLLYPQAAGRCMKQAEQLGLEIPFIGGDALSGDEVAAAGGTAVDGLMFCQPSPGEGPAYDRFVLKYRAKFNKEPSVYAVKSYDALRIAAEAISAGGYDAQGIKKYLSGLQDYSGASGVITLDDKGDIISQRFEKFIYRDGKYELMR